MRRATAAWSVGALAILLASLGSYLSSRSPAAVPQDAAPDRFSAARAFRHVQAIAHEPHPTGTPAIERVRRYLIAEIEAAGLVAEVQTATVARRWRAGSAVGRVSNVMARLHGAGDGKAVVIMSHYDSVPEGYGAGDDGAAVAAMLETMRVLAQAPTLANDVIFLFTDAEERGLLGVQAFLARHPWAADVGIVLNFDARGSRGPVLMFETNSGNGRLIKELRRGAPDPTGSSLSEAVYRLMPNSSDFAVVREFGVPGLNFAFIHGGTAYHTLQDSPDRLDLATLQHDGESMLGLARRLGNIELDGGWSLGRNVIYFNVPGGLFVSYPGWLVLPLALLALAGTLTVYATGLRAGRLTASGLVGSLLFNVVGAVLIAFVFFWLGSALDLDGYNFSFADGFTSRSLIYFGLALVAAGTTLAAYSAAARRLRADDLVAGGLSIWLVLSLATAALVTGGSYLTTLPLLAALVTALLWLLDLPSNAVSPRLFIALMIAAVVAMLLWPQTLALLGVALGGALSASLTAVIVFLMLSGLMAPLLSLWCALRHERVVSVAAVAAGALLIGGIVSTSGYDSLNRKLNSMVYLLDTDAGEAAWWSFDEAPDEWTMQFLGETPQRRRMPSLLAPFDGLTRDAPVARLAPAIVNVTDQSADGDGATSRMRIDWPYAVDAAIVSVGPRAKVRDVFIDDAVTGPIAVDPVFNYAAPPPDGLDLVVRSSRDDPLEITAVAEIRRLPALDGFDFAPRPSGMMAIRYDATYVQSSVTIRPAGNGD